MMDYDEEVLTELAMRLLEDEIRAVCIKYHIPGYDFEDLQQECRLRLWQQIKKYDFDRGISIKTWANRVCTNHLRNLLNSTQTQKRKANNKILYMYSVETLTFRDMYGNEIKEDEGTGV